MGHGDGHRQADQPYRCGISGDKWIDIANLDPEPMATYWRPFWSDDGKKIFYTLLKPTWDDPQNGIWIIDQTGENARQLLRPSSELGAPVLLDVTPQADWALVLYSGFMSYGSKPSKDYLVLLNIQDGRREAVILAEPEEEARFQPVAATFSLDGSKILYIYIAVNERQTRLAAHDLAGTKEHVLLAQDEPVGIRQSIVAELVWATNDTLFTNITPDKGVLWQLEK